MSEIKLSHSKVDRYTKCGKNYYWHYIEGYRPIVKSSSLVFGGAIDKALNELLVNKDLNSAISKYNDEMFPYMKDPLLMYSDKELNLDILSSWAKEDLSLYAKSLGFKSEVPVLIEGIFDKKKEVDFIGLRENTRAFLSYANYLSANAKMELILPEYLKTMFDPNNPLAIKRVIKIQEEVVLNGITGFIDFIAETNDGKVVVFDNKTASRPYAKNAAQTSTQLALYKYYLDTMRQDLGVTHVGFAVLPKIIVPKNKKICKSCGFSTTTGLHKTCNALVNDKRCNGTWKLESIIETPVQLLVAEADMSLITDVLNSYDTVRASIEASEFLENKKMCNNWYGKSCEFAGKCFNDSDEGLINIKNKEKQ